MFLHKTIVVLFISCLVIICCDCRNNKPIEVISSIDTLKINSWKKTYDSLYDRYYVSKEKTILKQGGIYADSILIFEKQLLKDTGQQKIFFNILFNRGLDLDDLNDFIQSRELLERYLTLYNEYYLLGPDKYAYAQKTLGNIYSRYGDYKKALLLLQQALKYYSGGKSQDNIASCILNISIPLKELKRYDEAADSLKNIFLFTTVSDKRKGLASMELADIYVRQNKLQDAGLQIQKAKQFLPSISEGPDRANQYATLLKIEGDWQLANNYPGQALTTYRRSLDSAIQSSGSNLREREIGKTYIAIGKAMEQLDHSDSALHFYNRALYTVTNFDTLNSLSLPQQNDLYAENTIAEALFARAACITKQNSSNRQELENAVSCYQLAFETEKKLLNAFSYDESRLYMLEETRKQTGEAIALCHNLYQKTNDTRWANQAFLFAESNKSFVLNESVKRNIAASLFIQKDSSFTRIQLLQSSLASVEIELNKQKFASAPDTGLVSKLLIDKKKLEESLLQDENALKIKNPQYTNWLNTEQPLTAEEITDRIITAGSSMIEYFVGDSVVYMFSAAKGKPLSFTRLPAGIKEACSHFLSFFSDRNIILNKPAEYVAAANNLYNLLSVPKNSEGNISMTIIPDGFISLIPFDALLTTAVNTTNISSFPFLIKQAEISYAFSCKTILIQQQVNRRSGDDRLIAFAPVFQNRERGFSPLLHSTEELEAVREFYTTGKYFTNADASLQKFKTTCSNASVIHLATHANAGSDSSIAGIEFYDSTLYLNNIYTLPLKAKLVVLSGCETGAGAVNKTEGLMSLARSFSYAGTQNVVAGLWQTGDKTSGDLFKNFYSSLSANTISASLRNAKLKLIQDASVSQASPFYWAGYICIGIPGEKISNGETEDRLFIFIAVLLLLAGAFMIIKNRKLI